MSRTRTRIPIAGGALAALALATLAFAPANAADDDDVYTPTDAKPNAEEVLAAEAEAAAVQSTVDASVSPGSYAKGDEEVHRIYADASVSTSAKRTLSAEGDSTSTSRFTSAKDLSASILAVQSVAPKGTTYTVEYDAASDTLQVLTTGSAKDFRFSKAEAADYTVEGGATIVRTDTRVYEDTPFAGGSRIVNKSTGAVCTGGFAIRMNDGTKRLVTAGHCGSPGHKMTTGDSSVDVGFLRYKQSYPTYDLATVVEENYHGSIWSGTSNAGSTKLPVYSAGNAAVGVDYCTDGASGYKRCGKEAMTTSALFCDTDGCTGSLLRLQGGSHVLSGDSGGAVYLPVTATGNDGNVYDGIAIRGMVVGYACTSGGTCSDYAHTWSTIISRYDATIIKGSVFG